MRTGLEPIALSFFTFKTTGPIKLREIYDMLKNTHKGRLFPIKDSMIPLFPDNPDCIKWKEIDARVLEEICSPGAQEGAEIVRVLWREKVIYIT